MNCKYCQSERINKYGKVKGIQRYFCLDCQRKSVSGDTIPKMQNSTEVIADSLNMHYEGTSLNEIRRNFIQQDGNYVSKVTPYKWEKRFTDGWLVYYNFFRPNMALNDKRPAEVAGPKYECRNWADVVGYKKEPIVKTIGESA
jgi:transposase-like protein